MNPHLVCSKACGHIETAMGEGWQAQYELFLESCVVIIRIGRKDPTVPGFRVAVGLKPGEWTTATSIACCALMDWRKHLMGLAKAALKANYSVYANQGVIRS